jgi:hypothetical protein
MRYTVSNTMKLIDLNGTSINFDIEFSAKSLNNEPFKAVVVNQTTLDNTQDLEYQDVADGEISGKISYKDNIPSPFYLVLKSDKNCEVDVEIRKKELPVNVPVRSVKNIVKKSYFRTILIFLTVVVCAGILYYFFVYKSSNKNVKKIDISNNTSNNTSNNNSNNNTIMNNPTEKIVDNIKKLASSPTRSLASDLSSETGSMSSRSSRSGTSPVGQIAQIAQMNNKNSSKHASNHSSNHSSNNASNHASTHHHSSTHSMHSSRPKQFNDNDILSRLNNIEIF